MMTDVSNNEMPIIPGRGLVTAGSKKLRLEFLQNNSIETSHIADSELELKLIQNNIESYIGTVEIPLGIVGPLKFINNNISELVYTAAGTLEGALIASMNRGAKAISLSGGFKAQTSWQRMSRAPLFTLNNIENAKVFESFITDHFKEIKKKAESFSNHAKLIKIDSVRIENSVHTKFIYTTGDASGQNMTTTCTWHAMLYIVDIFYKRTGINFDDFILEGNGSSDKKISNYSKLNGRGVNVTAECNLPEEIINQILRTTSSKMIAAYNASIKIAQLDKMVGYNINVANAIAAIYVATGQDLACIHESSVGILEFKRTENGLNAKLNLPNLVIGTVGGGTHLPKQLEALNIMKCKGNGKIERFAKLIAGFALGLELSTVAAIVSGEFAKAHEKLGRNKPINWLVRNELNEDFLKKCIFKTENEIISIDIKQSELIDNGILTHIAGRISKKLIGFEMLDLKTKDQKGVIHNQQLLFKSKALDEEVIKGLHVIAASIDPELSNQIQLCKSNLEYKNCHLKETEIYGFLNKNKFTNIPQLFGEYADLGREIHIIIIEYLDPGKIKIINSENAPWKWNEFLIKKAIHAANESHILFKDHLTDFKFSNTVFEPWRSNSLYNKLVEILINEEKDSVRKKELAALINCSLELKKLSEMIDVQKTIIHNDFNPRNIAINSNDKPIIYDWELAVLNYPHRDVIEFLTFTLPDDFSKEMLFDHLNYHYSLQLQTNKKKWFEAYYYSTLELIISRILFYEVAGIVVKYEFSKRILNNAFKILHMLKTND